MTIYNEAVSLAKLSELKSKKEIDKQLISDIFENTKGLIDIYLNDNNIDSNLDIEEVRQILSKALLEAIQSYRLDMVVPFSVYAYYKMDNILEEDLEYLTSSTTSLDEIYKDMEDYERLSSFDSIDDIKQDDLNRLTESLRRIDVTQVSNLNGSLSTELKNILLSLTEQERKLLLERLNVSPQVIEMVNAELCIEQVQKNKKNYL